MSEGSNHNVAMLLTASGRAALAVVRLEGPGAGEFVRGHFGAAARLEPRRIVHGRWRCAVEQVGRVEGVSAVGGASGACGTGGVLDDPVVVFDGTGYEVTLHGGRQIVRRFLEQAEAAGFATAACQSTSRVPTACGSPGAGAPIPRDEIALLWQEVEQWLPRATTEVGVRMLLAQPQAWRRLGSVPLAARPPVRLPTCSDTGGQAASGTAGVDAPHGQDPLGTLAIDEAARRRLLADRTLRRLLVPAKVAIVGAANVGKSTLANRLIGAQRSIVADMPGTTRDWVGHAAHLAGLPVVLIDTPGRRGSDDPIEQRAIALSGGEVERADLVVLVLDATRPGETPGFESALRVANKCDLAPPQPGALPVSARTGQGIAGLVREIHVRLGVDLSDVRRPNLWTRRQEAAALGPSLTIPPHERQG